ncbi:hypothetical protein FACS189494_02600 [Spirochaetia bacterium]|nr:hypothetical protein FACS189494_02600 [Spirochaetia bacterium]
MHCRSNFFRSVFLLCVFISFSSCDSPVYNDISTQGEWKKDCEINFINKKMILKIDSDKIYWKEDGAADWSFVAPCTASFGTMNIKQGGETIKVSYFTFFYYMVIYGLPWESGYMWMNGSWEKK